MPDQAPPPGLYQQLLTEGLKQQLLQLQETLVAGQTETIRSLIPTLRQSPTAPRRHLPAPAEVHRPAHAHEPHLRTADAHGTAGQPLLGKVLTGNGITA